MNANRTPISDEQYQANISAFEGGHTRLLSPEEARARGMETIDSTSTETIALICGGIHPRFKEVAIVTTPKEVDDTVKLAEAQPEIERRRIWKKVLTNLTKYSDEEFNSHYSNNTQEWMDWCDDAVIFFAYNAVIFKKGIPAITNLTAEQKVEATGGKIAYLKETNKKIKEQNEETIQQFNRTKDLYKQTKAKLEESPEDEDLREMLTCLKEQKGLLKEQNKELTESWIANKATLDGLQGKNPRCVLCGKRCECRYGNNPYPLAEEGRCCGDCNIKVILARLQG